MSASIRFFLACSMSTPGNASKNVNAVGWCLDHIKQFFVLKTFRDDLVERYVKSGKCLIQGLDIFLNWGDENLEIFCGTGFCMKGYGIPPTIRYLIFAWVKAAKSSIESEFIWRAIFVVYDGRRLNPRRPPFFGQVASFAKSLHQSLG